MRDVVERQRNAELKRKEAAEKAANALANAPALPNVPGGAEAAAEAEERLKAKKKERRRASMNEMVTHEKSESRRAADKEGRIPMPSLKKRSKDRDKDGDKDKDKDKDKDREKSSKDKSKRHSSSAAVMKSQSTDDYDTASKPSGINADDGSSVATGAAASINTAAAVTTTSTTADEVRDDGNGATSTNPSHRKHAPPAGADVITVQPDADGDDHPVPAARAPDAAAQGMVESEEGAPEKANESFAKRMKKKKMARRKSSLM